MFLASAYLFRDLSPAALQDITQAGAEESHPKGDFLFRAGAPASDFFVLLEGRVRLSVARGGHLAHIVSDPGEAIGWSSLVGKGQYTASAECLLPVRVFRIGERELNRILEADPASGLTFFRRLAALIGARLAESYGATLSVQTQHDSSYG